MHDRSETQREGSAGAPPPCGRGGVNPQKYAPLHVLSCRIWLATTALSRTISEINIDFSRKSQNFPTLFSAPIEGVPWNWELALWVKKLQ